MNNDIVNEVGWQCIGETGLAIKTFIEDMFSASIINPGQLLEHFYVDWATKIMLKVFDSVSIWHMYEAIDFGYFFSQRLGLNINNKSINIKV